MPRSSGIFTLIASYFATPGQTIRTEQHNPVLEDIANALTASVARDGTSPMLGNLPMNGRKVTGLGIGVNDDDAVRLDQVLSAFPTPTSANASGEWVKIFSAVGSALLLPNRGTTWAYYAVRYNFGVATDVVVGVGPANALVGSLVSGQNWTGFAWRIV